MGPCLRQTSNPTEWAVFLPNHLLQCNKQAVNIYTHMHTYLYVHINVSLYKCRWLCICLSAHIHAYVCVHIYIYIIYIYIYIYIYSVPFHEVHLGTQRSGKGSPPRLVGTVSGSQGLVGPTGDYRGLSWEPKRTWL